MNKKIKIYLCDLVHNYSGVGSYMFPLNIGYIAAYAKMNFPKEFEIKLFKYPLDFIKEFKRDRAQICGFANYTWNADLNSRISSFVKSTNPGTLTIFGGPNINYTDSGYRNFFRAHPQADFYAPFQGEKPFVNFLKHALEKNSDIKEMQSGGIDGLVYYRKSDDSLVRKDSLNRIDDLDSIPSPYLSGLLDDFFLTKLIPIMETNRGCPYTCTFCAQGYSSHNQLQFFGLKRVKDELDYIADRTKNTNILNFADANFGIVERDIEIAQYVAKLRQVKGYPRKFNTNWAKNQPKLFEIAEIIKGSNLVISLQSLDKEVLKNVKRTNISLDIFRDTIKKINQSGGMSGTEVILGLPGETKESHIAGLKTLFDWNVSYIICYNALLLDGTELRSMKDNKEFSCQTKFRLIDNSFGDYSGIKSFEAEEGIRRTGQMDEQDILYFRPVHWLIQFLWNYRFQYNLLKYLATLGINPLDYILKVIEESKANANKNKIGRIFSDFNKEAEDEWFNSAEELRDFYGLAENFKVLEDGLYGKLNGKYIFKVLIEAMDDFNSLLFDTAVKFSPACAEKEEVIKDIFAFQKASVIGFSAALEELGEPREARCRYDIPAWKSSGYSGRLEDYYHPEGLEFTFSLPDAQKHSLKVLMGQYRHDNINVTLRKMSEYMDITDFFYKVNEKAYENR